MRLRHRDPAPAGPCCWVAVGGSGPMCDAHTRAVAELAAVQGRQGFHTHIGFDGAELHSLWAIDVDRPGSATPGRIEDHQVDS